MEVIALNKVGNFQRASGATKKKQACENRRDDVNKWISLKQFHKDPSLKASVMRGHSKSN